MLDDYYTSNVSFLVGPLVILSLFISWYVRGDPTLDAIPTIGYSDPIRSYLSAFRFYFDGVPMLKEGYAKTRPGLFKISNFRRWIVLAGGSELIDDIRRAPADVLSRSEAIKESLQEKYTLDVLDRNDDYSTEIIRSKFTRDLASIFEEVREELFMAIDDLIPANEHEWVKVSVLQAIQRVVCRTTNRIFVGVPLCRDRDFQTLNLTFAINVMKFARIISWVPKPLKLFVSRMLSNLPSQIQQEVEFIRPIVQERFAKMEEYGKDWDDKPNDLLMWLMTEATGVERSAEGFARRLLLLNFAAIHTTSTAVTQVFYRLVANPEYLEPLREEVNAAIREEGWTKAGLDKMYKMDSFVRETQRLDGRAILPSRLALRSFTFSNGVTVPAGTIVSVPVSSTHTDERIYPNPEEFDGFRFANLRKVEGHNTTANKYQSVSPSNEYMAFGLGRHICPGRFFAVNEIKAFLAYIITTYDIKLEEGKSIPPGFYVSGMRGPATADVMFRARQM